MRKPRKDESRKPQRDPAALRSVLERALAGAGPNQRTDEQRAQELVYDALEAATPESQERLLQQAFKLDPENVDALRLLADLVGYQGESRIEVLRAIVAVGAKRLGKTAFKQLAPHFWGVIETRPYMRAREQLAEELRAANRLEEAIAEYEEMLALNENDNQGIRYHLLPSLLALGRLEKARTLMGQFDEVESSAVFSWSRVLERFLSGESADATKALAVARKANPHVEAYLTGKRKLPENLPDSYSLGSREEALCYAEILLMGWAPHPDARSWLTQQSSGRK